MKLRQVKDLDLRVKAFPAQLASEVRAALVLAHDRVFGRISLPGAQDLSDSVDETVEWEGNIGEETPTFQLTFAAYQENEKQRLAVEGRDSVDLPTEGQTLPTEEHQAEELSDRVTSPLDMEPSFSTDSLHNSSQIDYQTPLASPCPPDITPVFTPPPLKAIFQRKIKPKRTKSVPISNNFINSDAQKQQKSMESMYKNKEKYELVQLSPAMDRKKAREMRIRSILRENFTARHFKSKISTILEEEKQEKDRQAAAKIAFLRENRLRKRTYSAIVKEVHRPTPPLHPPAISFQTKLKTTRKNPHFRSISVREKTKSVEDKSVRRQKSRENTGKTERDGKKRDYLMERVELKREFVELHEGVFRYKRRELEGSESPEELIRHANRLSQVAVQRDSWLHYTPADRQIAASD